MPTHGDTKTGIFNPKRRDTLRPEFLALIGLEFTFDYAWTMDEGDPYPGQVAWLFGRETFDREGFPESRYRKWFPDEDIDPLPRGSEA